MPQLGTHVEAMQVGDTLVVVEATMVSWGVVVIAIIMVIV